jgi:hypothetical protein
MPRRNVEVEIVSGAVELLFGNLKRIEFFREGFPGRHFVVLLEGGLKAG